MTEYRDIVTPSTKKLGTDVQQYPSSASFPPAADFGVGVAQVGLDTYASDEVRWSIPGHPSLSPFDKTKYTRLTNAIRNTIAGVSNTRILFAGDSTTAGVTTDSLNSIPNSFATRLSEILTNSVAPAGWQSHYGTANDNTNGLALHASDNRLLDLPAGWATFSPGTGICGASITNASNTNPITFTPATNTDTLDVYYIDAGATYNQFEIKVGATVIGTATPSGSNSVKKLTGSTTLGANTYTIQRGATGAGGMIIVGFEAYDSAKKEISLINTGIGGSFLKTWLAKTPTQFWDALRILTDAGSAAKFDAVVLGYGINHWANSATNSAADFGVQLDLVASYLAAANIPLIIKTPAPSPTSVASYALQKTYVDEIYKTAATYGLLVVDTFNVWNSDFSAAYANGWMTAIGDVHPSKLGYMVEAGYLADAIKYILR
ncbi:MAG: hypothetical protein M0R47_16680 [Methylobacter sp.]|uniref:SGNH/GDSL hydrolase family protein n=1 Tax=Methylobacter sp. TaxID=2051955 RepID=UPI0025E81C4E|nr:hypothetical protein [Methylobacter sp.]MCK9622158.1 hypothetical protein [Methylobacter sp.]